MGYSIECRPSASIDLADQALVKDVSSALASETSPLAILLNRCYQIVQPSQLSARSIEFEPWQLGLEFSPLTNQIARLLEAARGERLCVSLANSVKLNLSRRVIGVSVSTATLTEAPVIALSCRTETSATLTAF